MSETRYLAVKDLIAHLQKMDPELPVYYVMFDDGYNIEAMTEHEVTPQTLERPDGEEFLALTFGYGWLL